MSVKVGKRLKSARELVESGKVYSVDEAVKIICSSYKKYKAKIDESFDIAVRLGVDSAKSDHVVRGATSMPHSLGKEVRVAVFAQPELQKEAKEAGADIVGAEELADKVKKGELNFDVCISTNAMMRVVGQLGKILGPKGLMPNPKLGTVTDSVADAVKQAKSGRVEFRADKGGVVHASVGKVSFEVSKIKDNLMHLMKVLIDAKPSSLKGTYIKGIHFNSTMGVSVPVDAAEFLK